MSLSKLRQEAKEYIKDGKPRRLLVCHNGIKRVTFFDAHDTDKEYFSLKIETLIRLARLRKPEFSTTMFIGTPDPSELLKEIN